MDQAQDRERPIGGVWVQAVDEEGKVSIGMSLKLQDTDVKQPRIVARRITEQGEP